MSKWVSVDDRLPEIVTTPGFLPASDYVLVFVDGDCEAQMAVFRQDEWFVAYSGERVTGVITH